MVIDMTDVVWAMGKCDATHEPKEANDLLDGGITEIMRLRARVAKLETALRLADTALGYFAGMKDFARWTDHYSGTEQDPNGVHGALEATRAALEGKDA